MSNSESFIDEVTEEVRRDRLFRVFRKYGWIAVVLVLAVVGGAAWNEWSKARQEARAQAFGDGVIDALDMGSAEDRRSALASVPADGEQTGVLNLILASDPDEDPAATLAALDAVAANPALSVIYRDLAALRRVLVGGADLPLADRRAALESITTAGRPYRPLAEEQLAYLMIEEGRPDEAVAILSRLLQDQDASGALRARAGQVIVALGAEPPEVAGG